MLKLYMHQTRCGCMHNVDFAEPSRVESSRVPANRDRRRSMARADPRSGLESIASSSSSSSPTRGCNHHSLRLESTEAGPLDIYQLLLRLRLCRWLERQHSLIGFGLLNLNNHLNLIFILFSLKDHLSERESLPFYTSTTRNQLKEIENGQNKANSPQVDRWQGPT